ncbi:ATP-dependent zinc metalloprotease FtsH 1 (plasmid) [Antarctobacter heliothermus]|uniref:ATP-dependent zinc metalloprotease FtsH 1 n=1 Tax=Antarctobacter heliothermus TaxID=74033 RepID=A0A222EBT1_9RHOB|nr:AAA family ATPase [Antarctobacter heliothermus]ASP23647.1 ATP-dependent zinc metalloprotease FtsH 1 [Antarctobacter heliothermus]
MTQFSKLHGFAAAKTYLLEQALTVSDLFERMSHVDDDVPGWSERKQDTDDVPLIDPPAPDAVNGAHCMQALAILQLAKTFEDRSLPDQLRDRPPVCLTVRDHEMGEFVEIAARALYPVAFAASRSPKVWRAPEVDTGKTVIALAERHLRTLLHEGHTVLMLTSPGQLVSPQLQELVGHGPRLAPLSREMILAVLSLSHTPCSPRVTEALQATLPRSEELGRLETLKLIMAFQAETALGVAERLSRFATTAPHQTGPSLTDVFGQTDAIAAFAQLQEDVMSWQAGEVAWDQVTSSLLLFGPPGCGKTLLPTAFANSAKLPLIKTSYAECQKAGHQGDMLRALDKAVSEAINSAPSVLFIDEIDAFYARGGDVHANGYILGVVTGLLTQIDRLNACEGVILVGATNHPDIVDEAVLRAGRFDRHIAIKPLDITAITTFLQAKLGETTDASQLRQIAERMIGATGAEIDDFIRKARTLARELKSDLTDQLLLRAANLYLPRPDDSLLRRIAVHEAGHLLAGHRLGSPPVALARVTPQGGAVLRPHRMMHTDVTLHADLVMFLAGRAAEQILCQSVSDGAGSGPDSDLARATRLALQAEAQFAFGEVTHLWHDIHHPPSPHDVTRDVARRATARLKTAEKDAIALLSENRAALTKIADTLFEQREIEGQALDQLLENAMRAPPETEVENREAKTPDSDGSPQSSLYGKTFII